MQEDVDVVGLSILSGAHMTLVPRIKKLLNEKGLGGVLLVVGGIIPEEDGAELVRRGDADRIFVPGDSLNSIIDYLRGSFSSNRNPWLS